MIFRLYQFIYLFTMTLVYAIFLLHLGFVVFPLLFTLLGILLRVFFKKNCLIIFSLLIPILPLFASFNSSGFPNNYLILPLFVLTGIVIADSIINKEFLSTGKETIPRHYIYYLLVLLTSFIFVLLRWSNIFLSKMAFFKNTLVDISGERLSFAIIFPILELALFVLSLPYFSFCQGSLNKNKLVIAFLCGQAISVLFVLAHYVLNKPSTAVNSMVTGLASDPTAFGMLCAISFILAWHLGKKESFRISFFFVVVFLIGIVLSGTRVAFMALAVLPFTSFRKISKSAVLITSIFAILILAFFLTDFKKDYNRNSVNKVKHTLLMIKSIEKDQRKNSVAIHSIASGREKLWNYSLEAVKRFPLSGIGAGNFLFWGRSQYGKFFFHHLPANQYLFIAVSNGLLGAGLFVLFLIIILLKKQWPEKIVILVLLLMFVFNDYLWFSEVFLSFWLICSLGKEKETQKAGKKEKLFVLALVLLFIITNIFNNSALLPHNGAKAAGIKYDYGLYYKESKNGQRFQWTGEKAGIYIYLDRNGRNDNFRLLCGAPLAHMKNRKQTIDIYWRGKFYKSVIFRNNNEYPLSIEDKECHEGFLEFRVRPGFILKQMNLGKETRLLGVKLFGGDIPDIQVISPNGGENWLPGSVQDIRWDSIGKITTVKIEMSYNGSRTYSLIEDSVANNGLYSWNIDYRPSMNCVVRISNESGSVTDTSDHPFVIILPPSLTGFSFALPNKWTDATFGSDGWYVGDFNGDDRLDIMRYLPDEAKNEVFLSNGTKFIGCGNWCAIDNGADGWYVGDFNGDTRSDLMRYVPGVSGGEVFLSNGSGFNFNGSWTAADNGAAGWYVGDFNGDGRSDIMRYLPTISKNEVFLSNGNEFVYNGNWITMRYGADGWYVGDFNGDGRSDIMRIVPGTSGGQLFLSDGTKFVYSGSWTGASPGGDGWYLGDFNGDKNCDIMRYMFSQSAVDVFLAGSTKFVYDGNWSSIGKGNTDWYIGDFNGDGRSDLMRYKVGVSGGDVMLSTAGGGSVLSGKSLVARTKWDKGRWLGDVSIAMGRWDGMEEKAFMDAIRKRIASGKEVSIYEIQKEYEKLKGRTYRRISILKLLKHHKLNQ